jgi:polysaccharide export outer membrane protein
MVSLLIQSCVPFKKVVYFNDISTVTSVNKKNEQKPIKPFDFLYIKVISTDEKTARIFNYSEDSRNMDPRLLSYRVDHDGKIYFPFVGAVVVENLTLNEAEIKIQKVLSDYIPNTAILVRYIENRVSIMGEVLNQGEHRFAPDKISIYEAIALAGGITRFGDRKKVMLMRWENDKINYHRLNLTDSKIANSEYYYILPGDIIVIEPLRQLSWSYQNNTYATILATLGTIATLTSLIILIRREY